MGVSHKNGEGVLQALPKIIEGMNAEVVVTGGRCHPYEQKIKINTSDILFICGGAFEGIEKFVNRTDVKSILGFNSQAAEEEFRTKEKEEAFSNVRQDHVVKFGLLPEFFSPFLPPSSSISFHRF